MGCTAHNVAGGPERMPRESFAVATPITVVQAKIKSSWAAHGAGTHVGFSLRVLSYSWGLALYHSAGGEKDSMAGHAKRDVHPQVR